MCYIILHHTIFLYVSRTTFRVERFVTSPLPHRSGRADFPHPVPHLTDSLKDSCEQFEERPMVRIG
ncbi:MAG: hypothetical protein V1733_01840, partial [bacterium]